MGTPVSQFEFKAKPCPFCKDSDNLEVKIEELRMVHAFVCCGICDARGPDTQGYVESDDLRINAIKRWNIRATP